MSQFERATQQMPNVAGGSRTGLCISGQYCARAGETEVKDAAQPSTKVGQGNYYKTMHRVNASLVLGTGCYGSGALFTSGI